MKSPYEILGVSPNATESEIKTAYRNLAKKYHPDKYANTPLADVAEEKMKEINEAYEAIMEMRKNGGSSSSYGNGGGYNDSYNSNSSYYNVRMYIHNNRIQEAEQILDAVDLNSRNAEWYFLRGMCYYRRGWQNEAYNHFQRACQMDPSNMEYRQALNNMSRQQSYGYGGYNTTQVNTNSGCDACDICTGLMCMNCLCNCCR